MIRIFTTTRSSRKGRRLFHPISQRPLLAVAVAAVAIVCFGVILARPLTGQASVRRGATADPAVMRRLIDPGHRERREAFEKLQQSGAALGSNEIFPSLLQALKLECAYEMERESRGESREDGDYYESLIDTAGRMRDKRAIEALALAAGTIGGVDQSYLADLAPDSVPALIELAHKPTWYFRGGGFNPWVPGYDTLRITLLRRGVFDQAPELKLAVIRELILTLDSPDEWRRGTAVEGLFPLRHDPVIRPRIEAVAAYDTDTAIGKDGLWYPLREKARTILSPPGGDKEWWVARSSDAGACRL
jgi:hypothetical protein